MASHDASIERLIGALTEIEASARGNADRSRRLQRRAHPLRRQLQAGRDLVELVEAEDTPRMVEVISTTMATLETVGAEFRAAEAPALRAHELTIEAIAEPFGVTRQRISALLNKKAAAQIDPGR